MRALERDALCALVLNVADTFRTDWMAQKDCKTLEIQTEVSEHGTMLHFEMLVDVYERKGEILLYSDIFACADHIYEELWKAASRII